MESIQKRGIIFTLKLIYWELIFDSLYGVDTFAIAELEDLGITDKPLLHGRRYQASNYYLLKHALGNLENLMGGFTPNTCLADIGSGKGRVLIMAAIKGVSRCIGLEISEKLNVIAQNNINILAKKKILSSEQIQLITGNAAEYSLDRNIDIVYLANPFDQTIVEKVINNILTSNKNNPRKIFIVYMTPLHEELFQEDKFELLYKFNSDYSIFRIKI
ncbi:MAG: class I SAM-dependent methyltransferase [Leptospira sp.]|nr:class I SAM-dependent methyltransferase [Leptospira sp.]